MHADLLKTAQLKLLEMHYRAGVGHIGGNLSVLPLLLELMHDILGEHDQLVLSKGHAAGAMYVGLWTRGQLTDADLETFHRDATLLSGHPPAFGIPAITFATGSLGHGLPLASGLALAARIKQEDRYVVCVTSDGEWNEGSMWESLIFAAHQRLHRLIIVVDRNGLQGFGKTTEVANLEPLADRFVGFGATVVEVDGHQPGQLAGAVRQLRNSDRPGVVLASTIKGHGVSFMENRMEWHYLPMNAEQYAQAVSEVSSR